MTCICRLIVYKWACSSLLLVQQPCRWRLFWHVTSGCWLGLWRCVGYWWYLCHVIPPRGLVCRRKPRNLISEFVCNGTSCRSWWHRSKSRRLLEFLICNTSLVSYSSIQSKFLIIQDIGIKHLIIKFKFLFAIRSRDLRQRESWRT